MIFLCVSGLEHAHNSGRIKTFCADAVLAPREDRHVSSPSDCFFGYHSPSAITRSLGLWFLSATSRSFLRLWLHPGRLAPDRSLSCLTSFIGLHSDDSVIPLLPVTSALCSICGWEMIRTPLAFPWLFPFAIVRAPNIHTLSIRIQPILTDQPHAF